jgi:hypothetical protein
MNGYNFTERVRKVLAFAREESVRLHHEYVSTEHILLGLGATILRRPSHLTTLDSRQTDAFAGRGRRC